MQAQPPPGMPVPGQMPTREQIMAMQQQLARDAEKAGMTVPQFIEHLKKQAQEQQARMQAMQQQQGGHPQHQHQPGQPQPIVPGPPNPVAIALAKFLRSQDLKPRTCILNGDRKDMFKGILSICPNCYISLVRIITDPAVKSNVPSALCNRLHMRRRAKRTRRSPRSRTAPRSRTRSSSFPCPCWPCASPK